MKKEKEKIKTIEPVSQLNNSFTKEFINNFNEKKDEEEKNDDLYLAKSHIGLGDFIKMQENILGESRETLSTILDEKIKRNIISKGMNIDKIKLYTYHNNLNSNEIEKNKNKNDDFIKLREIPEISEIQLNEIKYNLLDDKYLDDLKNFILNHKFPLNSPNSTLTIGSLFPLEKLVEGGFNNDPDFSNEMIDKYNLYLKYIYNYRTIKGDGNCYYRAVMFRYFEIIILNKEIELLRNIIYDMKKSIYSKEIMERKEIKLNTVFKPDLPLKIMFIILDLMSKNNIEFAHLVFLKSLLICPIFDFGLIFYFRYIIYNYIRNYEDKLYFKEFPIKIGNLLPSKYETEEGEFLYNSFYQNYLLKMFMDAEKIIIYLTPFILGINIDIIVFNDDNETIKNIYYEGKPKYTLNDKIFLMNRKNHYEIIYSKEYNEKYKSLFEKYINNSFLEESIILYEINKKNKDNNYININNNIYKNILNEENINIKNKKLTAINKKCKIKKKLKKQILNNSDKNIVNNSNSNNIIKIPSDNPNENYLSFINEEINLKNSCNENNSISLVLNHNEKYDNKKEIINNNISNDNILTEKENDLKVTKIKKRKKRINNCSDEIKSQRIKQVVNNKNIKINITDNNYENNKEKIKTTSSEKNKIISKILKEYECQKCLKKFSLEFEINIYLCYECLEKEIKNKFCNIYLSYLSRCLENEFEDVEIIKEFNNLKKKIININNKEVFLENAINQMGKYNSKVLSFEEIYDSIIKETQRNICLICCHIIGKNEQNIIKIPCGCFFCCEKHIKFYFSQKKPILKEKEFICYCSYKYQIKDIYNLGLIFSRKLSLNKLRKPIIEYLNNRLKNHCCSCLSKDGLILDFSIRYKDDENLGGKDIISNYKELKHYFCRNCEEKINDRDLFYCKICCKQHILRQKK